MKERPILFSTPMIQAILRGEKTQTRRMVKPQPDGVTADCKPWTKKFVDVWDTISNDIIHTDKYQGKQIVNPIKCPYGKVGDVLWVRETWQHTKCLNINPEDENYGYVFRADGQPWNDYEGWTWKPSIFMPKAACRIKLEITNIKVERLNDISSHDAIAEGIKYVIDKITGYCGYDYIRGGYNLMTTPWHGYKSLWESINGKGSFGNQWVWVIEFKRIDNE